MNTRGKIYGGALTGYAGIVTKIAEPVCWLLYLNLEPHKRQQWVHTPDSRRKLALIVKMAAGFVLAGCGGPPFELENTNASIGGEQWTFGGDASNPAIGQGDGGIYPINDGADGANVVDSGSHGDAADAGNTAQQESGSTAKIEAAVGQEASTQEATQVNGQDGAVSVDSGGCPPPKTSDGYSNICATNPGYGRVVISTFPPECACDWTCACLMKSSVCQSQGLGVPKSCSWVDGSVCNSVVLAVVNCQ